ncbi:MAG TPA: DUF5069 domain-containing protein [Lacunisphaera sp.]|jgi:hypothetical protein|nr:DUF5069 domain-containing protein [Lacunisphaera sp.]
MSDLKNAYASPSANAAGALNLSAPDLTRHPPRSPRVRLGGFVQLPRLIDKARAVAAGKQGDFHYNCPIDQRFLAFTGLDPDALFAEIKAGKSDSDILAYVMANSKPKRHPAEIASWSTWFEQLTPTPPDTRAFFNDIHRKNAAHRDDIATWFDWLDLDDYVTYGGKP